MMSEVPTVPRIKQLLVKENSLCQFYPGRSVVAIGTGQSICGVTITIFGVLIYPLESSPVNLYSAIWIGLIVIVSGLLGITSGRNDLSLILLKINFFTAIFTTAAISFVTIVAANGLLLCETKDLVVEIGDRKEIISTSEKWRPPDLRRPLADVDGIKRRDRIVSWIIEQSYEVSPNLNSCSNNNSSAARSPYNSNGLLSTTSTLSTRIYSYGRTIP
uniref:Uncharacterized protein n=1 Tax=Tetranychus urticae TaxID=32264 RepID=T1KJM3_TETUR